MFVGSFSSSGQILGRGAYPFGVRLSLAFGLLFVVSCGTDPNPSNPPGRDGAVVGFDAAPGGDLGARPEAGLELDASTSVDGGVDRDSGATDAQPARDSGVADRDGGTQDAGAGPVASYCFPACSNANDCSLGTPLQDADNYSCTSGVCEWQGCNSTQECLDTFRVSSGFVCSSAVNGLPNCLESCADASDCEKPSPIYGPGHWSCRSSACVWTGCLSDQECTDAFSDLRYGCDPSTMPRTCVLRCTAPSDCTQPGSSLFDADNYACTGGFCRWTGCNSDSECRAGFNDTRYVCRP